MLKTYITNDDLLRFEPSLADFTYDDEPDFSQIIETSKVILEQDIRNRGKKLRLLCVPLVLTDATLSDEDIAERSRLILSVSSFTSGASIKFEGTNDGATFTTINTFDISQDGEIIFSLPEVFKYYKLTKSGTVEYSAGLYETSFDIPLTFLALHRVYYTRKADVSDVWATKAKEYNELYIDALTAALYTYDQNDDGDIEEAEAKETAKNSVRFTR